MARESTDADCTETLLGAVRDAMEAGEPLEIRGTGSKRFYGEEVTGRPLDVSGHRGVVSYEPSELVMTARAGTPLADLEALVASHGQMLPFEPPHFGPGATIGGAVASGLSGPRRPYAGAVRDAVLGVRLVDGRGELGRYGGEVMKNVAGYDVSRLMAGALGTLGLLLDVSLKVLPAPQREATVNLTLDAAGAIARFSELGMRPLPLSGAAWEDGCARVRLSGSEAGVAAAVLELDGETVDARDAERFWFDLREHRLAFFDRPGTLWRLGVPPAHPPLPIEGDWLLDWGGGQRWLKTEAPAHIIREVTAAAGGHATAFRGGDRGVAVFHPIPDGLLRLHRRVKAAMDPGRLFNPGRLYAGL